MFTDVVALYIAHLDGALSVPVSSRVPNPRPAQFVQARRVGGNAAPPVRDRARIDVWAWAGSSPDAMALALNVRELTWGLSGNSALGVVVYRVDEFMGPRQDDDEVTGTPRVWATYELMVRADDVIHTANPTGS